MEYTLFGLLYIIQNFFNLLLNLMVADDVPLGGIIIAVMILGTFLKNFRMDSGSSSRSAKSSGATRKEK